MPGITANVPLLNGCYDITIEGDRISSVQPSDKKTDLCVGPTLFDIQVNGYGGRTCRMKCDEERDALRYITDLFRQIGVGWWIPTITTAQPDVLQTAFRYCGEVLEEDADLSASIPGLHLEGPFISPEDGPRGAHERDCVRPPDWDEFQKLQDLCGGRIAYVTIAGERPGAVEFTRKVVDSGVVVSLGHTDLDRDSLKAVVDAGASMSTHLGNGAHDMIQRHNNYIWYQLACRKTYASFISDGHHLPQEALYSMVRAKGLDFSIITSDCISLGGMAPGVYQVRDREVEKLPNGRVNLKGTPFLAGSADNLLECTEKLIRLADLPHADGWRLASLQPANMLGLDDRLGIEAGKEATLTAYRYDDNGPAIDVRQTWVAGKKVFDAESSEPVEMLTEPKWA